MHGCDKWAINGYGYGRALGQPPAIQKRDRSNCNHPSALGWVTVAYFITFCIIGSQVLLTLFIGIIASSLEESKEDQRNESLRFDRALSRASVLGIGDEVVGSSKVIFDLLDAKATGVITREDVKSIVPYLPFVKKVWRPTSLPFATNIYLFSAHRPSGE